MDTFFCFLTIAGSFYNVPSKNFHRLQPFDVPSNVIDRSCVFFLSVLRGVFETKELFLTWREKKTDKTNQARCKVERFQTRLSHKKQKERNNKNIKISETNMVDGMPNKSHKSYENKSTKLW